MAGGRTRRPATPYGSFLRALLRRDRPVYVHYAVTSRCNLHCRTCEIWRRQPADELELDEIQELATVLGDLGCVQVSLGGGEPALREDLPEIVRAFLSRGIRTRVLTNGVALTPAVADRLLEVGLTEVSFSLDSLDRTVQERMDDTPGAFDKRLRNLLDLANRLPARSTLPILNTVVTPHNLEELPEIASLAADLGFFASFIPIHLPPAEERDHRFYGDAPELRFGPGDADRLRRVFDRLIRLKRRGAPIVNSTAFLRGTPGYLMDGSASWPCRAGVLFHSVSPQGRVAPCHAFEGRWEVPFRDLPDHLRSRGYLEELRCRVAACEGCFRPCWAEVSFMMLEGRALLEMARTQLRVRLGRRSVDLAAARRRAGLDAEAGP